MVYKNNAISLIIWRNNVMSIIDFREIPQANKADGKQDSFELFAREFLHAIGL